MRKLLILYTLLLVGQSCFGQEETNQIGRNIITMDSLNVLLEENRMLKERISDLEALIDGWFKNPDHPFRRSTSLYKSIPSPSDEPLTITYKVNRHIGGPVSLSLFDMKGKKILDYNDLPDGLFSKRVKPGSLKPGSYMCSLMVRGHIVDSQVVLITRR